MHDVHQRDIGNDGRQECVLDNFDVGYADKLDHQKCRGPHHRWRQLAIG